MSKTLKCHFELNRVNKSLEKFRLERLRLHSVSTNGPNRRRAHAAVARSMELYSPIASREHCVSVGLLAPALRHGCVVTLVIY
jgi:hypothetical protein